MKIVEPKVYVEKFDGLKIMKNIELACRTCYRSEGQITEDSYKKLLQNCINKGHESVLEHEKITIRMICDIGVYKDLTRHRFASFSIESSRYCAYNKDKFNNEIKFIKPIFWKGDEELFNADIDSVFMFSTGDDKEITNNVGYIQNHKEVNKTYIWYMTMKQIEQSYMEMSKLGCTPDEMRMILPHSTAAEVTMTCNIREWKHILELRANKFAHPSVQQVMIPIAKLFKEQMPEIFNNLEYNENFNGELASISFDNKVI